MSRVQSVDGAMPEPFIRSLVLKRELIGDATAYPFSIPAIAGLSELELGSKVTLLCGANASGKSTLIEAIAVACGLNPEGGGRNFAFETRGSHSQLGDVLRLVRGARRPKVDFFLRAESYFNVASEIEALDREPGGGPPIISYYGGVSLHEQSHGQSFIALLVHRFGPDGLYILDEPEAALSPQGQLALLARMHELVAEALPVRDRHALADPALVSRRAHLRAVRRRHRERRVRRHGDGHAVPILPRCARLLPPAPARR